MSMRDSNSLIFQAVEQGTLSVFEALHQLDQLSAHDSVTRKNGGVIYTPEPVAAQMIRMAQPQLHETILEPSCGRGVFIFSLAHFFIQSGHAPSLVQKQLAQNLRACDLDGEALMDLRALWLAYWKNLDVVATDLLLSDEDSLFNAWQSDRFDLTVGNPPYVRFQNLNESYRQRLQKRFSVCAQGNVDLYYAFIQHALSRSKRTCFITPNSWLSNTSGERLRRLLHPQIIGIIDFGAQLLFASARTYTSILLAAQDPAPHRISPDYIYWRNSFLTAGGPTAASPMHSPRFSPKRWSLRPEFSTAPPPLTTLRDYAQIYTGIATLCDSVFSFQAHGYDPHGNPILNFNGTDCPIPSAIAPKLHKLTKINAPKDLDQHTTHIIAPYDAQWKILSESSFQALSGAAYDYLSAHKVRLSQRDKGKTGAYDAWYAYGRKQGLHYCKKGPCLILAGMSSNQLRPLRFEADRCTSFLFTSGFILEPHDGVSLEQLIQVLESPETWNWILAHGKEWAGGPGTQYRSYGARLLAQLPVSLPA